MDMMRVLPLSSSQTHICPPYLGFAKGIINPNQPYKTSKFRGASAKKEEEENKKEEPKKKQSLFSSVTEALDFSQVRSAEDAVLIEKARETTQSGGRMNQEQYGALRRKIGGTYKDFFKSYVEVDGQYVEEGWVDKTCKVCKKDTKGEPRQVDSVGRYIHVACLEKSKSGNFFTKLFS
ncbi:hypothetical protein GIB67_020131 [Kingdonia uniflora]|uniref:GATA-type transcription activator N-terminal domain-containing protein n=2 Tax=Kingdonia uniflora TaxID=39325 RepID=A0A7J7NZK7_9MAGN|nr:hypothetical protein GIB67_020131 [Kingdonia uniflora]